MSGQYYSIYTGEQIDDAISIVRSGFNNINYIGTAGSQGFGVGICPPNLVPSYVKPLLGTFDITSDDYGNYYSIIDGSIMVWIPRFYYKYNVDNTISIKGIDRYPTNDNAVSDGYVVHRMFINNGTIVDGIFVDKYDWSLTNFVHGVSGIASSIKNGNPISSNSASNRDASNNFAGSFSDCISNGQTPSDNYGGAWAAAKSRGDDFAVASIFIYKGLALLSLAHAQASTSTTNCAWYHATNNFPKGNNSYGTDTNDGTCTFSVCDDGYWASRNEARKTGSGNSFAKTTHNGQNCGVADLNGNQLKIAQGLTAIVSLVSISGAVATDTNTKVQITTSAAHGLTAGGPVMVTSVVGITDLNDKIWLVTDVIDTTNFKVACVTAQTYTSGGSVAKGKFYSLKESVDIRDVTGGNSLSASDHFNDTYILANFDEVDINFADGGVFAQRYGNSANQVIPFSTDRSNNNYLLSSLGLPAATGMSTGGSNQFGQDYFYQYLRDELCALSGGNWGSGSGAGVWFLYLSNSRTYSFTSVSARSCLYV